MTIKKMQNLRKAKPKVPSFEDRKFTARRAARARWAIFEIMLLHHFRPDLDEVVDLFEFHKANDICLPLEALDVVLAAADRPKKSRARGKHGNKIFGIKEFRELYLATREVQTARIGRRMRSAENRMHAVFARIENEDQLLQKRLERYAKTILQTADD